MHVEAGIPPLQLFLEQHAVSTGYKLYLTFTKTQLYDLSDSVPATASWPRGRPLSFLLTHNLARSPFPIALSHPVFPSLPHGRVPVPSIHTDLPFRKGDQSTYNMLILDQWTPHPSPDFVVYTDASRFPCGYAATGFWAPSHHYSSCMQLPDFTSIFYAEAFGLELALQWILSTSTSPSSAVIFTDSLSVLHSLQQKCPPSPFSILASLQQTLYDFYQRKHVVTFVWVPSHSNITGNDYIDHLVTSLRPLPWCSVPLPLSVFLSSVKHRFFLQWQKAWLTQSTHLSSIRPLLQDKFHVQCSTKLNTTTLTVMRLGRLRTNALRARWDSSHDASCPFCPGEPQTVHHILLTCPVSSPQLTAVLPVHCRALSADQRIRLLHGIYIPAVHLSQATYDRISEIVRASLPAT